MLSDKEMLLGGWLCCLPEIKGCSWSHCTLQDISLILSLWMGLMDMPVGAVCAQAFHVRFANPSEEVLQMWPLMAGARVREAWSTVGLSRLHWGLVSRCHWNCSNIWSQARTQGIACGFCGEAQLKSASRLLPPCCLGLRDPRAKTLGTKAPSSLCIPCCCNTWHVDRLWVLGLPKKLKAT